MYYSFSLTHIRTSYMYVPVTLASVSYLIMIKFTPLFNSNLTSLFFPLVGLMIPEADSSNSLTFCMLRPLATWSGVFPEKAPSLTLAPHFSNSCITSMFSASTAWCRGVRPLLPSYRKTKTGNCFVKECMAAHYGKNKSCVYREFVC